MRETPAHEAANMGVIPANVKNLRNEGCQSGPGLSAWAEMSQAERTEVRANTWCQVEYDGIRGWVPIANLVEAP